MLFGVCPRFAAQRVIPFFRGEKRACVEGGARPRKNRNPVPEAVGEEQPAFVVFFEEGTGYSLQRAESGFRSFSRYPIPSSDPSRLARKNRNDIGLGLFVMKDSDAFFAASQAPLLPGEVPDEDRRLFRDQSISYFAEMSHNKAYFVVCP